MLEKSVFVTLMLLFLIANIFLLFISYANAGNLKKDENPQYSFIAGQNLFGPQSSFSPVPSSSAIVATALEVAGQANKTGQLPTIPVVPHNKSIDFGQANKTVRLKIITHNENDCKPQSSCASIASFYPTVSVHTFQNNQYLTISSFPGSEVGRTVNFTIVGPAVIQYDVSQSRPSFIANMTTRTSSDCEGVLRITDNKTCMINNYIYSSENHNPLGQLKIITHNENDCKPQSSCASIASFYPTVSVHTFQNHQYLTISSFPGSEVGRTVNFFMGIKNPSLNSSITYYVSQSRPSFIANMTTSSDCDGVLRITDSKVCIINNLINNNRITSQNTTTLSAPPPKPANCNQPAFTNTTACKRHS
jgi:hypothetical protein